MTPTYQPHSGLPEAIIEAADETSPPGQDEPSVVKVASHNKPNNKTPKSAIASPE